MGNLPSPMWHKALVGFSPAEYASVMEKTLGICHNAFKMVIFLSNPTLPCQKHEHFFFFVALYYENQVGFLVIKPINNWGPH